MSRRAGVRLDRTIANALKWAWKWLGWIILVVLFANWGAIGPTGLIVLAVIATLYFAFRVPAWCGAETRQERHCRNNSHGLLLGCHFREHKWQKFSLAARRHRWKRLGSELWMESKVGTVGLAISGLTSVVAIISAVA